MNVWCLLVGLFNTINVLQCVFEVDPDKGLTLTELAEGVEVADIVQTTGCEFKLSPDLIPMRQVEVPE